MKRWTKLLLLLLALALLSQIPFAWRRYRLGRLHAAIQQLNSQRVVSADKDGLVELKGVMHVHTSLGGHSTGTLADVIAAAQDNQLNFVVMTEHPSKDFNTAELTLKGEHGGVLFINGNEVNTANGDRLLLLPGDEQTGSDSQRSTQEVLARRSSGLAFVAYPQEFKSWEATGYQGIEVYNVYTNARQINPVVMFFDGLWSYRSYPDLLFANFYLGPQASLNQWDDLTKGTGRRIIVTAGNDAHANVGLSLNDSSGRTWLGFKLDPYERSFRLVRLHVLTPRGAVPNGQQSTSPLDETALMSAISAGHCFIGFDLFGDTTGFRFAAHDGDEDRTMGDEIKLDGVVKMTVKVPVPARIFLVRNGSLYGEAYGVREREFEAKEPGVYRVEVDLPQLPEPLRYQPWIISNPIYVK